MKNLIILLSLIIFNFNIAHAGNEKSVKNTSGIDPVIATSGISVYKAVTSSKCNDYDKNFYIIAFKSKGKIQTIQVLAKDRQTGILEMKSIYNQSIEDLMPDPCHFSYSFDQVVK